jgi:diguanylate cyclase (GGDEF)-like protein/putative nucleotidyltransferase with HDIG domain
MRESGAQSSARGGSPSACWAQLERVVDRLGPLPVIGGTVAAVRAAAESDTATTSDLVALIERDEAFAANVLRFGSSAALSSPLAARSVRDAVVYVGRRALGRLALEAATYQFLQRVPGAGRQSRGQLHIHALAVAGCAGACAHAVGADVESVHLAALLHDVGKLILPLAVGDDALEQIALSHPGGAQRAQIERDLFGVDHAQAGALLAERSSVSAEVVEAIAFHHGGAGDPHAPSLEAACLQVGNAVVAIPAGVEPDVDVLQVGLARLGLPQSALEELAHGALPNPRTPTGRALRERVVELERLAQTDELTGLANRRAFLARVAGKLAAGAAGCLLIVDIDHFKALNDGLGHLAGDRALTEVAHLLGRHAYAGRLGGDEFALWSDRSLEQALELAEDVCQAAQRLPAPSGNGTLSVSIGVAAAPSQGSTTSELLAAADAALYEAKAAGRARFAHIARLPARHRSAR